LNLLTVFLFAIVAGGAIPMTEGQGSVHIAVFFVSFAALAVGTIGSSKYIDKRSVHELGLQGDAQWWRDAVFGLFVGAVLPTVVFGIGILSGLFEITGTFQTNESMILLPDSLSPVLQVGLVFLFFVGVAVTEELAFRGYLLQNIAEGLNGWNDLDVFDAIVGSVVISSLLFALLHTANPSASAFGFLNITLYGILFALTFVSTERLGLAIGIHLTWNFFISTVYGFNVSGISTPVTVLSIEPTGPALLTGGGFGPEGGLLTTLVLFLGLGLCIVWVSREYETIAMEASISVLGDLEDYVEEGDSLPGDIEEYVTEDEPAGHEDVPGDANRDG
jgi:hypothetical protein